jgi:hypothetical protein
VDAKAVKMEVKVGEELNVADLESKLLANAPAEAKQ